MSSPELKAEVREFLSTPSCKRTGNHVWDNKITPKSAAQAVFIKPVEVIFSTRLRKKRCKLCNSIV
jgi:hypothetical protein